MARDGEKMNVKVEKKALSATLKENSPFGKDKTKVVTRAQYVKIFTGRVASYQKMIVGLSKMHEDFVSACNKESSKNPHKGSSVAILRLVSGSSTMIQLAINMTYSELHSESRFIGLKNRPAKDIKQKINSKVKKGSNPIKEKTDKFRSKISKK